MVDMLFEEYKEKLSKTLNAFVSELANMKAGRANPRLLDKVLVDYYGNLTPINQVGNISIPEARILMISVWDNSMLKAVEKAIIAANIGVTPNNDGKVIRLIFPELTTDRRKDLVKQLKAQAESCKVVLRNTRRDINDSLKKMKKNTEITEDECSNYEKDVDTIINEYIAKVDKYCKEKETEIMSV
ncbi:MAG: ribosome recycling factor [Clostridia bacterium]